MAVDIIIQLTSVGTEQGNLFDLYSNNDGFNTPYETDVSLIDLQTGYLTSAPNGTITVRVCGKDPRCTNCVDITPIYTTTTSTTLPLVECGEIAQSGGVGITEYSIPLESDGGILVIDFEPYGVPDKLEILHDNIKVATSGMSVANSGPFDNVYGDPTVPNNSQTLTIDQFIGTQKGAAPKRETEIFSTTGKSFVASGQQLVWFEYTSTDVLNDPNATIRVTGPSGTAWNFTRLCDEVTTTTTTTTVSPSTTTTTTTTSGPTTTTTTTTLSGLDALTISSVSNLKNPSCIMSLDTNIWVDTDGVSLKSGDILYTDSGGLSVFSGDGNYYHIDDTVAGIQVSARVTGFGEVLDPIVLCSSIVTTTTTTTTSPPPPSLVASNISAVSALVDACPLSQPNTIYVNSAGITIGEIVYSDAGGLNPFVGDGNFYKVNDPNAGGSPVSVKINASGVLGSPISICGI